MRIGVQTNKLSFLTHLSQRMDMNLEYENPSTGQQAIKGQKESQKILPQRVDSKGVDKNTFQI